MTDTAWTAKSEVKCRCGQVGEITGVEGPFAAPDNVWVTHRVGLEMRTHIHRQAQMPALTAQRAWRNAGMAPGETDTLS